MPKGGARVRSGPAPDLNALRRDKDSADWTVLPAEGRRGNVPDWPLPDASPREVELWRRLWGKPQAVLWERLGQHDLVALYVRRFAEAEVPDSTTALSTLVKQLADYLLLTIPAMHSAKVRIAEDELAPKRAVVDDDQESVRAQLEAVTSGGS